MVGVTEGPWNSELSTNSSSPTAAQCYGNNNNSRDVNKAGSFKAEAKSLKAKAKSLKAKAKTKAKARDQG